jgi:hypothetical protein
MLEELDKAKELAEGIQHTVKEPEPDDEERDILREFEDKVDAEIEKEELKVEEPLPRKDEEKEPPAVEFE